MYKKMLVMVVFAVASMMMFVAPTTANGEGTMCQSQSQDQKQKMKQSQSLANSNNIKMKMDGGGGGGGCGYLDFSRQGYDASGPLSRTIGFIVGLVPRVLGWDPEGEAQLELARLVRDQARQARKELKGSLVVVPAPPDPQPSSAPTMTYDQQLEAYYAANARIVADERAKKAAEIEAARERIEDANAEVRARRAAERAAPTPEPAPKPRPVAPARTSKMESGRTSARATCGDGGTAIAFVTRRDDVSEVRVTIERKE